MRGRIESFDILRGLLMLLGIPFHASLIYSDRDWSVSAGTSSEVFTIIGGAINSFRMPAFFLIAGYLSLGAIRKRGINAWLQRRVVRLGVPFLGGMIFLNPLQMFATAVDSASYTFSWSLIGPKLLDQLSSFGPHWIRHLWFLPALLVISVLFAILLEVRRVFAPPVRMLEGLLSGSRLRFLLGASVVLVVYSVIVGGIRVLVRDYTDDVFGAALFNGLRYLPSFCLGVVMAARLDESAYFGRPSLGLNMAALIGVVGYSWIWTKFSVLAYVLQPVTGLLVAFAVFPYAHARWTRLVPMARFLSKASYCIYLVHQPLVGLIGVAAVAMLWPPILGYVVVSAGTLIGAIIFYLIVEKSWLLRFIFNGEARRPTPPVVGVGPSSLA